MVSDAAAPSSSALYGGGERGAGGKLRKPSARKPPSTPYDRPPSRGGWISKLVGGATRVLPSFFSRLQTPEYNGLEEEENAASGNKGSPSNPEESEAVEGTNHTERVETLNTRSDADLLGRDNRNSTSSGTEFSKIEQLVKGQQFSRDDADRLLQLLHSKVADAPFIEPVERKPKSSVQREGEGSVLSHETPRLSKEKQESLNVAGLGTSMPLLQSNVEGEVGASPIDVARAYMGKNTDYRGTISKYGVGRDKYASQSLVPSSSPKTSVCWPGAMAEERFGSSTPQSVSTRYGLQPFQQNSYSRSISSKSKSKLARPEADSNRFQNWSSSTRLQAQAPVFGQRERTPSEISGSVGPIRRMSHRFLSEASPRRSVLYQSSQNGNSPAAVTKNILPSAKNFDSSASKDTKEFRYLGSTLNGSEAGSSVFQTSSPAIKTILEHLDRHVPTPKEKAAELQLATSSNKSSFSTLTDAVLKEGNDPAKSNFLVKSQEISPATDLDKDTKTSTTVNGKYETASFGIANIRVNNTGKQPTSQSQNEGHTVTDTPLNSTTPDSLKRPPHHPSGSKPFLAYLSVDKPHLRVSFLSDNKHSGFTFPVSSSSGALPEPPTPSVMPFIDGNVIPKFTFGDKRSATSLSFSFPSTSNGSVQGEVSDLKFSFGEGNTSRFSFKSAGKDAICY